MTLPICHCFRWRYIFPAIIILSVIFFFDTFPPSGNTELKAKLGVIENKLYPVNMTNGKATETANRKFYDSETLPGFKDEWNIAELCAWGYEPKETWHRHFQSIFYKYNMTWTEKSFPELKCNATFKPTLTENMDVISSYPFDIPEKYLDELSLNKKGIDELSKPADDPIKYPVFVTACSSIHYTESQGLIQTYHQLLRVHPDLKMIYYDLGLTSEQRNELKKYCMCEVRTFDARKYPSHVAARMGYAWKPVIIQTVLKEYDLVMWMDASIRYNGNPLDEVSLRTRQRGVQGMHGLAAIFTRTSKKSFEYLKETPCLYNFPEVEAGWLSISRNRFTLEFVMKPWVSCALAYNCMVYRGSDRNLTCSGRQTYHKCHRFDQSILGIIVNRLFHEQRRVVEFDVAPILSLNRGHHPKYFEELKKLTV